MAARDDYPRLAGLQPDSRSTKEAHAALDEIDRLRDELGWIRTTVPPDFFDMLDMPDEPPA